MATIEKLNEQLKGVEGSINNLQFEINDLKIAYAADIASGANKNGSSIKLAALGQQLETTYEAREKLIQAIEVEQVRVQGKDYKADLAKAEKLAIDADAMVAKAKAEALAILQVLATAAGMRKERIILLKKCNPAVSRTAYVCGDVVAESLYRNLSAYVRDAEFVANMKALSKNKAKQR